LLEATSLGFGSILIRAVIKARNPVVAGIDPRTDCLPFGFLERFPGSLSGRADACLAFARDVIDVLFPLVPAVKFQAAFYEALGPSGMVALADSLAYARSKGLVVILDGKRNDIGSTAEAYAEAYLGNTAFPGHSERAWQADALTINPYLGGDGVDPFLRLAARNDRGLFLLVRTSNPSARDFQDLVADGKPIYRHVADRVAEWGRPYRDESGYSLLGAVVGATYPEQLSELREALPGVIFLVPGYGTQGGTAKEVAGAFDANGLGAVVNNSRGLTFAYQRKDLTVKFGTNWQGAIEAAAREMIDALASETPAGKLS
jgi:orotidine-5'-phosphate decarboxylase